MTLNDLQRARDGLDFAPLKLKHLGGGDIGGDIEAEIAELAKALADVDSFGLKAKGEINLKICLRRDKQTVVITTDMQIKPPRPLPKATFAFAGPRGLVVQPAEQLTVDSIRKAARGEEESE
jgi:hypothetical protein